MRNVTNRRALAVFIAVCLLYVTVGFRIPEKLSMKRIGVKPSGASQGLDMRESAEPSIAEARADEIIESRLTPAEPPLTGRPASAVHEEVPSRAADAGKNRTSVEPRFLISVPIICYAIREGWIDREALIFSRKAGQNNVWSKPLDILKQQDEDSLKSLVSTIGKNRLKEFFKNEAVDIRGELSPEDMALGRGYVIEKKKLISLYDRFVSADCNDLFPLAASEGGVVKGREGFRFVPSAEATRMRSKEQEGEEWRMPDLNGLSVKLAIDRLAVHTARIKVHGSGFVVDQSPKAFERLRGDSECAIYGKLTN